MSDDLPPVEGGASLPLDVICRKCGAKVGFACTSPAGNYTFSHAQRWRDVGILSVTERERNRDHQDLLRRERERLAGFEAALAEQRDE